MNAFRATYTLREWDDELGEYVPNEEATDEVMVIDIHCPDVECFPVVIFIRSDGRLASDTLPCFTRCWISNVR